ncbi:MAG: ribonuclease, partial [Acidobacteriota bacterium]|nr:ribonuclease [Acidobacteriota bacterium]
MPPSISLPQRPELHQEIIALLRQRGNRLLGRAEIHERLQDPDVSKEAVERAVDELEQDGVVIAVRGKRYSLLEFTPYHAAVMKVHPDGHGTLRGGVVTEGAGAGSAGAGVVQPDIYIDRNAMKGAMNADFVIVRLDKPPGDRKAKTRRIHNRDYIDGEVIRILRRAHRTVVGRFHTDPEPYVVPYDFRLDTDIIIDEDATMNAQEGVMVNVEIDRYPDRSTHFATGRVVEVIGFIGDPGVDIEVVIRKHHIPHIFPEEVLRDAENIPTVVPQEEIAKRVDLRGRNIVTIDGETAKDFD